MVSLFEGAMSSVLEKLGDLLTEKYRLHKEVKDDIIFLKSELDGMHAFLKDMSDVEKPNERDKCWVKEVRELSYDIEDSIDDFMVGAEHELESSSRSQGLIKDCIAWCTSFLNKASTRDKSVKEFQSLKRRVVEANERRKRFKADDTVPEQNIATIDHRLVMVALYTATSRLVGVDKSRDELIQLMNVEGVGNAQQLKVLAIWGFGGLGKTTLANEIYRKLEGQFQCRSFVSVSQKPNIRKILTTIFTQVGCTSEKNNMEMDENELISAIHKFLMDKRYFIVIDDIWDTTAWEYIKCAFSENKNGSTVIATTRIESVAILCCSNNYKYIYPMRPLSNEDSRILFFKRIFGSEDDCPPYLKDVSTGILKRCGGLPLAIITISSLLAIPKNKLKKEQWEDIMNSLGSNLELNPTLDGMRQILSLSYKNLPHYLKTCMLYLGIYPEDHIIEKKDLVRQWAAQGFINKASGQDIEDVAEGYFNELVNRSIIQPVQIEPNDDVLSCRVHDMMLDLIIHKCRKDNFVSAIDNIEEITELHDKVRRLSLNFVTKIAASDKGSGMRHSVVVDYVRDGTTWETIQQVSQVRVLTMFGGSKYKPPLLQLKHLRVLSLEFRYSTSNEMIDLTGVGHLFQLRYLKILSDDYIKLPSEIRGLQHLETLEIIAGLYKDDIEVLSDVVHLPRLLHLTIPSSVSLPERIGCMKSLRTLEYFQLEDNSIDNIRDLGDLTNLRVLNIRYKNMETRERLVVLRSSIEKLCNLRFLCLLCDDYTATCWCDEFSSLSACPRLLQRLRMGFVSAVPRWISELHSLYSLELWIKQALGDDVGILAQLPSLLRLDLYMLQTPEEDVVICRTGFSILKHFQFNSTRLAFEAGAMPALQKLRISCNAKGWDRSGAAPAGIEHLPALREVSVFVGGGGAKESNRRAAQSAFRDAIDAHPGRPTPNIEYHIQSWVVYPFDIRQEREQEDDDVELST